MARYEFKLPDIGEGIAEAEIVAWHVKPGDRVEEDQKLADVMTDKATVEMESPVAGTVVEIAAGVGASIPVGSILIVFDTEKGKAASARAEAKAASRTEPKAAAGASDRRSSPRRAASRRTGQERRTKQRDQGDRRVAERREGERRDAPSAGAGKPAVPAGERPRAAASPAVRKRARDLGIDLALVRSAQGDRIRHSDLDAFLLYHGGVATGSAHPERPDEQVEVRGLRRRIAENMEEAKRRIPHFSYVEEVDVTALEATRAMMNEEDGSQLHLSLLPFVIAALCRAAADFPQINARYDDEANVVTRHGAVHMGVATQTDAGLMVPVIRDAQQRDIRDLADEVRRLSEAARAGTAAREELGGSTITVSSLGALGGIASTPVVNRPEVAIVAVNKAVERPVVIDGEIQIRRMMNLSSSFDHRVVDGYDAAQFIQKVKHLLEHPLLLLSLS